jgi:hypothetical protein
MGTLPRTLVKWEILSGYLWGYYTEKYQTKDTVLLGVWYDFGPMDKVLGKIGPSELGDKLSR